MSAINLSSWSEDLISIDKSEYDRDLFYFAIFLDSGFVRPTNMSP